MFKKLSKILLSVSLSVLACGGIFSAVNFKGAAQASAGDPLTVTVGSKTYTLEAEVYKDEEGNETTFYKVDTVEDLSLVSFMVSIAKDKNWASYNYQLENDINLGSRNWTAIGTYDNPYTGTFNGNGFTINGLNASKKACESEVFYVGENVEANDSLLLSPNNADASKRPIDGAYYKDCVKNVYYKFETNKGYVLQTEEPSAAVTTITPKDIYYYGLFGRIENAEISDVVLGKGCYAYRNNDQGVTAYSGILVAYAEGSTFYNIYDSMADADAKMSGYTNYYIKTRDSFVTTTKTYYTLSNGVYTAVDGSSLSDLTGNDYYERVMKIDTGRYTYYYVQSVDVLKLYRDPELTDEVVAITIEENKIGSFVADDKAYYYDYDYATGRLCLNLKERYIVNSIETIASETEGEDDTIINSIEVAGKTYYLKTLTGSMELYTTSEFEAETKVFECMNNSTGYVTLGSTAYPYRYENSVFKILAYSEVCTIGYVSQNTKFYKGNYYRLNSTQYVGIGTIEDNPNYQGTINIGGVTYQYVFKIDDATGNSQLSFYTDAQYGYPTFIGRGNKSGVGIVSINNVDYIYNYNTEYKDLELSLVNNYLTEIPYTVAETEGTIKVEKLEVGMIISFNVAVNGNQSSANYYQKGTSNFITAYRMIYDDNAGLSNLDYNNNFVSSASTLPTNYFRATDGSFYIVSDTPGYIFEYWTVPNADGKETIVYSDNALDGDGKAKGLRSYILSADTAEDTSKTYYTFNETNGVFEAASSFEAGKVYEEISTDDTVANIKANNYQVNAVWKERNYTLNIDVDGTVKTLTVGYGTRWDTIVSQISAMNAGYDLTGVYYYNGGFTSNSTTGDKVYAYTLQYYYDNYGNLSNYSFLKTTDTEIVEDTEYYIYDASQTLLKNKFQKVENPVVDDIASYYVKAENVAIYGNTLDAGNAGNMYFAVQFDTDSNIATTPTTIYVKTDWQKQPVNGKVSFTNTTDIYIPTKDTSVVTGKNYYTYNQTTGAYTLVTTPKTADIKTYFEETNQFLYSKFSDVDYEGVVKPISVEAENTDTFFKLDDYSKLFGVKFTLNTGYAVNYILPANTGVLDISTVGYYLYNAETKSLTYVAYNADTKVLDRTSIDADKLVIGSFNSSEGTFTEYLADGGSKTYGGSGNALETDKYYIDVKTNENLNGTSYALVYIYDGSNLNAQTTLNKKGYNYTYIQKNFTVNSYKLYIDIAREQFSFKITVTQAEGLSGTASFTVVEDGNSYTVQTADEVNASHEFNVKYDSEYLITGVPSEGYSIDTVTYNDMSEFLQNIENGNLTLSGKVSLLNYAQEVGESGETIEHYPEYTVKLVYATFDAYTSYTFVGDKYDSSLTNVTLPSLQVSSTGSGEGQLNRDEIANGEGKNFTSYGVNGNVSVTFTKNDYYELSDNSIPYEVYACESNKYTLSAGQFTVTNLNHNEFLAKIKYNEKDYYILKTDLTVSGDTYSIAQKNLYTFSSSESTDSGISFSGVKNKQLMIFNPQIKKVEYAVSTLVKGYVDNALVDLKDVEGDVPETNGNIGNVVEVRDGAEGSIISKTVYGDEIFLNAEPNTDAYNFTGYRLSYGGSSVEIAKYYNGTWQIGDNFKESSAPQLGSARKVTVGTKTYIAVKFDKASIASFGNDGVVIYGIFEGNERQIELNGYTEGANSYNAFIKNFDGTGEDVLKPYNYNQIISKNESSIQNIKFGEANSEKTISYAISSSAPFSILGFAVYASYTDGSNLKEIYIIHNFDSAVNTGGELKTSYKQLFLKNGLTSLIKDFFAGNVDLYILPVLSQKTITINLTNGGGEGETVSGLVYYASGNGLDVSAYADRFSKVGYSTTGWAWMVDSTEKYKTLTNVLNLKNVETGYYGQTINIQRTYKANTYKVYFDLTTTGGELVPQTGIVIEHDDEKGLDYTKIEFDSTYTLPQASKVGYTFNGWLLGADDFASNGTFKTPNDITLVPSFTANNYNVKINANKGTISGDAEKIISVTYDTKFLDTELLKTTPVRAGYTFAGWYAYENGNTIKINDETILSVDLNTESVSYVKLNNTEASVVLMAAWERIEGYYKLTDAQNSYTTAYSSLAQNFEAITDVKANGASIFDATAQVITPVNNDSLTFTWLYKSTAEGASYRQLTNDEIAKYKATASSISLTNVAESGTYKLVLTFADTATALTQNMIDLKNVPFERELQITITPLVVEKTLESSYETEFDTTSSPDLGLDLTAGVNNEKVIIGSYKIGNTDNGVFAEGVDAGTYNTIRFFFTFKEGYTYVNGNYSNVKTSGGDYYFDQATSIKVNPKVVNLAPVVNEIAYTGAAATISFTGNVNLNYKDYTLGVDATSLSEAFGQEGQKTTITISNTNFTIIDSTKVVSEGKTSNYKYVLSGSLDILGENVRDYSFLGHLFTKISSDADFSATPTIDKVVNIEKVVLNQDGKVISYNPMSNDTGYEITTMAGISYIYAVNGADRSLCFQLNNNAKEIKIYSMFDVESVSFTDDLLTFTDTANSHTYYLFGYYTLGESQVETEVAQSVLANYTSSNKTLTSVENGKTYFIGYTDLVKVTLNGLGNAGADTDVKYVKLSSALKVVPSRISYKFIGWDNTDSDERITLSKSEGSSVDDTFMVSGNSIVSATLTALWELESPKVGAVQNINENATEGKRTISVQEILGGTIEDKIINYNPSLSYTFEWFDNNGKSLSKTSEFTLDANALSNGTYKLRLFNSAESTIYTDVEFTVTFNQVEIAISAEGTKTTKEGNFDDVAEKALVDGKFTYAYSFGNAYDRFISISVPASTNANKVYVLADNKASGNIYFTVTRIKDALGASVTEENVALQEAGTYKITLCFNNNIYKVASESSFEVEITPFTISWNDASLKALFGTEADKEVFEKTFGDDNASVLNKTIYITNKNVLSMTKPASGAYLETKVVFYNSNIEGLKDGEKGTTLAAPASYDITEAKIDNVNYKVEISATLPKIKVNANDSQAVLVSLNSATKVYDGKTITDIKLEWSDTASAYVFNAYASDGTLIVTFGINTVTVLSTTADPTVKDGFELLNYNVNQTGLNIKDAGDYITADLFKGEMKKIEGSSASLGSVQIAGANLLTINKKDITITKVTKPCDMTTDFDENVEGHVATIEGLVTGEDVIVKGTFADAKVGTSINVTNLTITGEQASNYKLTNTTATGEITSSQVEVSASLTTSAFDYGTFTKTIELNSVFEFKFTTTEYGDILADYITGITNFKIVDSVTENDVTDVYSTGGYLRKGTYKISVTFASTSFAKLNRTETFEFTVNAITVTPVYDTITKVYNGNTTVEQVVKVNALSGDVVTVDAVYENAQVGQNKVVRITLNSADKDNYILSTSTILGEITEREGVAVKVINIDFVDGQPASGHKLNADGKSFDINVAPYNDETTGEFVLSKLTAPTKDGYTFKGFFVDSAYATELTAENVIGLINASIQSGESAFTIYAKWEINTYTVTTLQKNHTTITIDTKTFNYYDDVTFEATSDRGYDLSVEVYATADLSTKVTYAYDAESGKYSFKMSSYNVTIATTATAQTYTISYTLNGGNFETAAPSTHTFGTSTDIENPAREGHTFLGWIINGGSLVEIDVDAGEKLTLVGDAYTADITLEAQWKANVYRIYFSITNPEYFEDSVKATLTYDTEVGLYYKEVTYGQKTTLPIASRPGYGFKNWVYQGSEVIYVQDNPYVVAGNTTLTATYEAGTYTVKFTVSNATVAVYNGAATADNLVNEISAGVYSLTGGNLYTVKVTANAGYTVKEWTFNGQTYVTEAKDLSFVKNEEIAIIAEANENTITISINEQDKLNCDVSAFVDNPPVNISNIEGKFTFIAKTGTSVVVKIIVHKGYSLGDVRSYGNVQFTETSAVNNIYEYSLTDFVENVGLSVSLTANSYRATIKKDSNQAITDINFKNEPETENVEGGVTVLVTTGKNIQFTTEVKSGFEFVGVKYANTTILLNTTESNIEGSGINIGIENGLVTITGFVEEFQVELLTAKQEYKVNVKKVAINETGKNDETVTNNFTIKINEVDYSETNNGYTYGDDLAMRVASNTTGYKFVGWFTQVTVSADEKVTYDTAYRISEQETYAFVMENKDITYYAVYEITYVKHTFSVVTNDDNLNTKGGVVYIGDTSESVIENNPLYMTNCTYTAKATQGYKFVGWFYVDSSLQVQEATLADGYTITVLESDNSGNATKVSISFNATSDIRLIAKFEAKELNVELRTGLLINGVLTYPNESAEASEHVDYGNAVWGTYNAATGVFTPDANGTSSTIRTRTDDEVYVKVTAKAGYLIDQITNTGDAVVVTEKVLEDKENNYVIYKLSAFNADAGEYKLTVRFYSTETAISFKFISNGETIQAGQFEVEQSSSLTVAGNRTSTVVVTATTNSQIKVRVYTKLGYRFETYDEGASMGFVKIRKEGTLNGVNITAGAPSELAGAPKLGYTQYVDIIVDGYTGGYVDLAFSVFTSSYNLVLKSQTGDVITTITGVKGGTEINNYISSANRTAIKALEPYEGFSLLGFFPYSNGAGQMFIDAEGNGKIALNDNGYYWAGSNYEMSPYYSIVGGTGTFTLYAVYSIDKTIIEIVATPKDLETTAPTVGATVVIGNLNSANSWTNINQPLYAEVLYGAKVSATAPRFDGYVFSFWKIERINRSGIYSVRYNSNETIPDLAQDGYKAITLTAVYNVKAQVASTGGGSATITGYNYTVSPDGLSVAKEEINVTNSYYLSSLDSFTYKAVPNNGYTFRGWEDEEGTIVSTAYTYVVPATESAPKYLKAVFEGDAKVLRIVAEEKVISGLTYSLAKVTKRVDRTLEDGTIISEEEITDWSEFNVKVGDEIILYMNIPSQEYEAVWTGGYVENDLYGSEVYRVYRYFVAAEDEIESQGVIQITASYETRMFNVGVTFDLDNKASNDELKLAGKVKYNSLEIASGYNGRTIYGREVQIAISVNKNYKVKKIEVDGSVVDLSTVFKPNTTEGLLRIQTSAYDYAWQQSVSVVITFERALWIDDVVASGYTLSGKGTVDNPYKIESDKDLAYVAYMINVRGDASYASANYELLKDIDLTGKYWSPIGTDANPFKGSFDFNVFEISGVTVVYGYAGATSYNGVFGVTGGANIFKTESNVGLIIGIVAGSLAVVGIAVGIFLGGRAKKKRELDKLANS